MDWREAPGQKRMAISSADGSARSVRAIGAHHGRRYAVPCMGLFEVLSFISSLNFNNSHAV